MKSFFKKLLPFLFFFFLVSCSNGVSKASLLISVGNSATRGAKEDLAEVGLTFESFKYVIDVTYPDKTVYEKIVQWGDSLLLDVFDEGYYSVKVSACLPNIVEFIRQNMNDEITEEILAKELGKYSNYLDLPVYEGKQTKYVSAHGVTPFSIKLKLTPFFGGEEDDENSYQKDTSDMYADIAGTYFARDSKTLEFSFVENYYQDAPDRCRANIDISEVLNEYHVQSGDTVVFTISGKPNEDVPALYWQLAASKQDSPYEVYKDTYNSYCSLNGYLKAGEDFSLPMPINRIVIPDGAKYDTVQFFYDGTNTSFKIENFTLSFRIYNSSKNVYECSKTTDGETIYNEFIVALKDYPAFDEARFDGAYYFAATTTNGANISIDVLELWDGKVGEGGTWVAKSSNKNMTLSYCYIGGGEEFGGANRADLKNCLLQYKSKALYPHNSVTLVGFDIMEG